MAFVSHPLVFKLGRVLPVYNVINYLLKDCTRVQTKSTSLIHNAASYFYSTSFSSQILSVLLHCICPTTLAFSYFTDYSYPVTVNITLIHKHPKMYSAYFEYILSVTCFHFSHLSVIKNTETVCCTVAPLNDYFYILQRHFYEPVILNSLRFRWTLSGDFEQIDSSNERIRPNVRPRCRELDRHWPGNMTEQNHFTGGLCKTGQISTGVRVSQLYQWAGNIIITLKQYLKV